VSQETKKLDHTATASATDAPQPSNAIVAVLRDLIFATKIRSTAKSLGIETFLQENASGVSRELSTRRVSLVIVDLNTAGAEACPAIRAARAHPSKPHVVAYVSHVDEGLARQAAQEGAHDVMPRSRFNSELVRLIQQHCVSTTKDVTKTY